MTDEEAIEYLECPCEDCKSKDCDCEYGCLTYWAYITAKKALEKQIPKKPIEHSHFRTLKICPLCRSGVNGSNYCAYCGQRINWGNN